MLTEKATLPEPIRLPRSQHTISRSLLDPDALRVLYRLHNSGHIAYLVGGSVRDLLLGRRPRDFDIGTDAHPSRLRRLFRNCRIIGRRFRLAHIYFHGGKIVEVATFRRHALADETDSAGRPDFNAFGTPAEDALRRDITINGLFYDIASFAVIDYVGGLEDLRLRRVRTIKDPATSFTEDPVRIIRVMRHAARTGFEIDALTWKELMARQKTVLTCSLDRVREEFYKDLSSGYMERVLELLHASGLLYSLFPEFEIRGPGLVRDRLAFLHRLLEAGAAIDRRVAERGESPPSTSLLLSILLLPHFSRTAWNVPPAREQGLVHFLHHRLTELLAPLFQRLHIPRETQTAVQRTILMCERIRQGVYSSGSIPQILRDREPDVFADALDLYLSDAEARGEPVEVPAVAPAPREKRRRRRRHGPGPARRPRAEHQS